ncbi:MAG: toxin-antitoxin (TA) system antitoxin [Armatimonadetes bacterium]|nr:toxin-antitoxin (TA) system antitoxin [Armatimonadota bacterium]
MPTTTVDVQELPARLEEILSLAQEGTEVIVTEDSIPRARLLPYGPARIAGLHAGAIQTTDDFDDPLPEAFWTGTP